MASVLLSNAASNAKAAVTQFEIRPEQTNLVLRGPRDEAASVVLKGTGPSSSRMSGYGAKGVVVLCLREPLRIQKIKLRLDAERRIGFHQQSGRSHHVKNYYNFERHDWTLLEEARVLPAGNYEWSFDKIIEGTSLETLEGLRETFVSWHLNATLERPLMKDLCKRNVIRIVRTPNPADVELFHETSVASVWADKIDYHIDVPSKAVAVGSDIKARFRLIPLLKGLKIGRITVHLVQREDLTISKLNKSRTFETFCAMSTYDHPEEAETQLVDGQDGFEFNVTLRVPRRLCECVQDFQGQGIKIRHKLKFSLRLRNPDGHESEVKALLPIHIFIPPHWHDEDAETIAMTNGSPDHSVSDVSQLPDLTPPRYGEHEGDALFEDVDSNGARTPASGISSGAFTPHSRNISSQNLGALAMTSSDNDAATRIEAVQARLNSVALGTSTTSGQNTGPTTPSESGDDLAGALANRDETPVALIPRRDYFPSRHHSYDASMGRLSSVSEHIEDIIKVPSYSTAMRSNSRIPIDANLPSYQAAVSPSSMHWALAHRGSQSR